MPLRNFDGVHVTTITPFHENYEVDYRGLKSNVQFLAESGISSLVPLGTVGEFASLTVKERKTVAETVVGAAGKKKTIVGVASTSFSEVIDLAKHAADIGADAILIVPPYYFKDREEGLLAFLEIVSRHSDLGIVIYNLPGVTKVNLTALLIERILKRVDNVIAIKDATKDLTQLLDTINIIGKRIPVIAGAEELALYGLLAGSPGMTSGMGNFAPEVPVSMYNAVKEGKLEEARSIFFERILRFRHLDVEGISLGYPVQNAQIKEAMRILGMSAGPVRPPLAPLSQEAAAEIAKVIRKLGPIGPNAKPNPQSSHKRKP